MHVTSKRKTAYIYMYVQSEKRMHNFKEVHVCFVRRLRRQVFSWCGQFHMGLDATKPVWSFRRSEIQTSLLGYRGWLKKIKISHVASLDMVHSRTRIRKAPTSLRGQAVWSALLYFTNPEDRFSRIEAHYDNAFYS